MWINSLLFICTTYFINPLCWALSPVALAVVLGYSFTKRFTSLCHIVLGIGLALAPVGAYIAVTEQFSIHIVVLGFAVLFWVSGFDVIYALQDIDFDKENKLNSIPTLLGRSGALRASRVLHLLSASCFVYHIYIAQNSAFGWVAAGIFCTALGYQQSLVKPNDLSKVNLAFFTTNGIASVCVGLVLVVGLVLHGR